MKYAVVIERAGVNLSAYVPDLPGCIATGSNASEVERLIREAITFHLEYPFRGRDSSPQTSSLLNP